MQYLMVFACKINWRPVGVPVSNAEALQRFGPFAWSSARAHSAVGCTSTP